MKILHASVVLLIGFGLGVVVDGWMIRSSSSPSAPRQESGAMNLPANPRKPRLIVVEPEFDFGIAERGSTVKHNFVLQNTGTAPVEILGVSAACKCTVAELSQRVIPPGAELLVHAELDLHGLTGPQRRNLQVRTSDPATPTVTLTLLGQSVSQISLEPAEISLGRINPDDASTKVIDIQVTASHPIEVQSIDETDGLKVSLETVEVGWHYRISVSLAPPLDEGPFYRNLTVRTNGPREYARLRIPFSAAVMSPGTVSKTQAQTTVSDLRSAIPSN